MFADDTNLFYSHKNIKILFKKATGELEMISQWFMVNKLSLTLQEQVSVFGVFLARIFPHFQAV